MPDFIAPDQLDAAVQAGMRPVGGDVHVTTADGRVVTIDAADYAALRPDFEGVASTQQVLASQDAALAAERQAQLQQQSGRAFGEAAFATAWDQTLGAVGPIKGRELLSRIAGTQHDPLSGEGAMYAEGDIRRYQYDTAAQRSAERAFEAESRAVAEANPNAAGWGKFTGTVGGGLAANAATGGLGGLGAAGTIGRLGVAGFEGGMAGLTTAREEAFIKNEALTTSAAWDAIGHGAIFGAAIGGAFTLAGKGLSAAYRATRGGALAAAEGLEAAAAGTRGGLRDALESSDGGVMKALQKMHGADPEVREALETLGTRQAREAAVSGPGNLHKLSREVKGAVNDLESVGSQIDQTMTLKTQNVDRLVNPALVQAQKAVVPETAAKVSNAVTNALEELHGSSLPKQAREVLASIGDEAHLLRTGAQDMTAAELFLQNDGIKRGLQKSVGHIRARAAFLGREGNSAAADHLYSVASKLEETETGLRLHLEDSTIWGEKLAGFQRELNEGWVEALSGTRKYSERLTRQGDKLHATGQYERLADSAGIDAWVKSAGSAGADDLTDAVAQRMLGHAKMLGALRKYGMADESLLTHTEAALTRVQKAHAQLTAHADASRALGVLTDAGNTSQAARLAEMVPGVGKLLGAAFRPAEAVRTLAMLERATDASESHLGAVARTALGIGERAADTARTATSGARTVVARGARAAARNKLDDMAGVSEPMRSAARTALTTGGVSASYWKGSQSPQQAYQARLREIDAAAAPGAAEAHAATLIGPMGKDAPKFAAAFATQLKTAADFLKSKAPAPPDRTGELQGNRKLPMVDHRAVEKFGRYWTAVNQPLDCAALLSKGQLRPEHVEALAAVHPQVLETLQNAVLKEVANMRDPIPQGRARQLDILLHLGGKADPTIRPDNLRIMAQVGEQTRQQPQKPPQGKPPDIAKQSTTRSAQLAGK